MASAIGYQILFLWRIMHLISGMFAGLMLGWSLLDDGLIKNWIDLAGSYVICIVLIVLGSSLSIIVMHFVSIAIVRGYIKWFDPSKKKTINLRIGAAGGYFHFVINCVFDLVVIVIVPLYVYKNKDKESFKLTWVLFVLAAHFYCVSLMGIILRRGFIPFFVLCTTTLGMLINVTFTHHYWVSCGILVSVFVSVIAITLYYGRNCLRETNQIFNNAEEEDVGFLGTFWFGSGVPQDMINAGSLCVSCTGSLIDTIAFWCHMVPFCLIASLTSLEDIFEYFVYPDKEHNVHAIVSISFNVLGSKHLEGLPGSPMFVTKMVFWMVMLFDLLDWNNFVLFLF